MNRRQIIRLSLRLGLVAALALSGSTRSVPGTALAACSVAYQRETPDAIAPTFPEDLGIPLDGEPPAITAKLANDTGASDADCITSDPTIVATLDPDSTISISAALNDASADNFVELFRHYRPDGTLGDGIGYRVVVQRDGKFKLRRPHLEEIAGRPLSDGKYTLYLQAKNPAATASNFVEVSFLLDTQAPLAAPENLDLLAYNDSGSSNSDNVTKDNKPTLGGTLTQKSEPEMEIELYREEELIGKATTRSDRWQTTVKELPDGVHLISAKAVDRAGNVSDTVELELTIDTKAPELSFNSLEDDSLITPKTRLAGGVNGSGSEITALSYQLRNIAPIRFSNTAPIPIPFVRATGGFLENFQLGALVPGMHDLSFFATDLAGNTTTVRFRVRVDLNVPFEITDCIPGNGAIDVGVTYMPQIFFSKPIAPDTLNSDNLFATFGGRKLAAKIVPADSGMFAWLFFREPLPDASAIRLTIDGSSILPLEGGDALNADRDRAPGGVLTFDFSTVSLVPLPNTTLSGILIDPGGDRKPNTSDDAPIVGAKVFLIGLEESGQLTGADGRFQLDAVPGGGTKLAIDASEATSKASGAQPNTYFPEIEINVNIAPGVENYAAPGKPEIFLPRLSQAILKQVNPDRATRIQADEISAPELSREQREFLWLEIQPNSLLDSTGEKLAGGRVGISTISLELLPNILPNGVAQEAFIINVQAPGTSNFSNTAPVSFPNLFDSPPGSQLNFVSFDSITGKLVVEGAATVSSDGQSVRTDPGVGITRPGWHGLVPARSVVVSKHFSNLPSKYGYMQRVRTQMGCADRFGLRRR